MIAPDQLNVEDVPDCLRNLADAIEADRTMAHVSVLVLLREPAEQNLSIFGFGKSNATTMEAFTECHIAADQLMEMMRNAPPEEETEDD